ncbi:MAG: peptidylprolyl isomerase [Clostridia bacterium]|nr:peptidylprolyl isomerase [Clostridia bacterium]
MKNLKNVKIFISGVLAGALFMAAPAIASGVKQLIEAELNTVNITVDGVKVDGENILYNDRTYVPLRQIAEMLGKDVAWDEATNTADIADSHKKAFDGETVGKVGDTEIKKGELDMYVSLAKAQNQEISDEDALKQAKENIAYDEALTALAKENGVEAGEEFEASYKNYIKSMNEQYGAQGGASDAFSQLLNALGYSDESYKRVQEMSYIKSKLIQKNSALYAPKGDEIAEYYAANKEQFKYDGLKAKHILFSTVKADGSDMSESEIKKVENKAYEVYNKIKNGGDFDALMNQYSEDPGLSQNPDGYTFTKGDMVKEFEDAAYNLDVGKVSTPVKSAYGYHIIKVVDKIDYIDASDSSAENYIVSQIKMQKLDKDVQTKLDSIGESWN